MFRTSERRGISHFLASGDSIRIKDGHIRAAVQKRETGQFTAQDLADWASFVLMCHLYDFQDLNEDQIEQLNELALLR